MVQELKNGTTLQNGKYRIEKVLGSGTFGITYLAIARFSTEGNLGKMDVVAKVAIKEFFMHEVNGRSGDGTSVEGSSGTVFTNYRRKFKKEAENLSKLSHKGIVKVFDVFDENNTTYYVMEYIEGITLDDYIEAKGHLDEAETINVIQEVGEALTYMHSRKMLHLDIKPKNIMRQTEGRYLLIDFGLSKQFTDKGEPESSTSIGLGTPGYSPVEQAGYKQDGTFPATLDVYALGATMFKMLAGHRPPEATYILNDGFPLSELQSNGVSESTVSVLQKAMKPMRKQRYQTVRGFLSSLGTGGDVDNEDTVVEMSPKPSSVTPPPPKPKPVQATYKPRPQNIKIEKEPEKRKRSSWFVLIGFLVAMIFPIIGLIDKLATDGSKTEVAVDSDTTALGLDEELADSAVIEDSVVVADEVEVVTYNVNDESWESPLGKAVYTGMVSSPGNPEGRGVAQITGGKYAGNVYDGEFRNGTFEGKARYTLNNGDTFVGTFKNNEYDRGRYTFKSDGTYFEGSFKNGQPYKGSWYNPHGRRTSTI